MTGKLIKSMPESEYRATDAISVSGLKEILRSPRHYQWRYLEGNDTQSPALEFGRAFHALVLEPDSVTDKVAVLPDINRRTNAGKDEYATFLAENAGKTIINSDAWVEAKEMAQAVLDNAAARLVLTGSGHAEVSAFWRQGEGSHAVDARARYDWMRSDGLLVDLKTTVDASAEGFGKQAYNFGYHMQAWFYMEGYRAATGKEPEGFCFIAVEKSAPYCVGVYVASPEMLELGRMDCEKALGIYRQCREENYWPGYPEMIQSLHLPKWAENRINLEGNYTND